MAQKSIIRFLRNGAMTEISHCYDQSNMTLSDFFADSTMVLLKSKYQTRRKTPWCKNNQILRRGVIIEYLLD